MVGNHKIINYVMEYRLEGGAKWTRANEQRVGDREYTVKGLKADTNTNTNTLDTAPRVPKES